LPNDHIEVTDLYLNVACSLKKQGKYSEATKMQRLQLATLLQIHGEDHYGVVNAYNGIAGLLVPQYRLDDALQMIDRALEICNRLERLRGRNKDVLGGTLCHKAAILYKQGNLEAAMEVLNKVITMQIETGGEMHPITAQIYEDQARKYFEHDMVEGAIEAYAKAIKIQRKELGNDHPHTKSLALALEALEREKNIRTLNEKGLAMKAKGDLEKAIQLFQEALDIYTEASYVLPRDIRAVVYEHFSSVKVDQGLLEDAIAASAEALKIRRRTLGDDHADTKRRMEAHRSLLKRLLENRS
jgi:tetratricopeptide (TPR) repeat protein